MQCINQGPRDNISLSPRVYQDFDRPLKQPLGEIKQVSWVICVLSQHISTLTWQGFLFLGLGNISNFDLSGTFWLKGLSLRSRFNSPGWRQPRELGLNPWTSYIRRLSSDATVRDSHHPGGGTMTPEMAHLGTHYRITPPATNWVPFVTSFGHRKVSIPTYLQLVPFLSSRHRSSFPFF